MMPLELAAVFVHARAVSPGEGDVPLAGAPQHLLASGGSSSFHGVSSIVPARQAQLVLERLGHALINMPPPAAQLAPRADQLDSSPFERQARIGNQPSGSNV